MNISELEALKLERRGRKMFSNAGQAARYYFRESERRGSTAALDFARVPSTPEQFAASLDRFSTACWAMGSLARLPFRCGALNYAEVLELFYGVPARAAQVRCARRGHGAVAIERCRQTIATARRSCSCAAYRRAASDGALTVNSAAERLMLDHRQIARGLAASERALGGILRDMGAL